MSFLHKYFTTANQMGSAICQTSERFILCLLAFSFFLPALGRVRGRCASWHRPPHSKGNINNWAWTVSIRHGAEQHRLGMTFSSAQELLEKHQSHWNGFILSYHSQGKYSYQETGFSFQFWMEYRSARFFYSSCRRVMLLEVAGFRNFQKRWQGCLQRRIIQWPLIYTCSRTTWSSSGIPNRVPTALTDTTPDAWK